MELRCRPLGKRASSSELCLLAELDCGLSAIRLLCLRGQTWPKSGSNEGPALCQGLPSEHSLPRLSTGGVDWVDQYGGLLVMPLRLLPSSPVHIVHVLALTERHEVLQVMVRSLVSY